SFIPYKNIACKYYDALFISSHKLIGGIGGSGLLAIKKELCGSKPSFAAGGTVGYVSRTSQCYLCNEEALEEGGTPGILQLIRASLAFKIKDEIGIEEIEKKEEILK
ncbi:aminotransferase, partial [Campylobacter coli]